MNAELIRSPDLCQYRQATAEGSSCQLLLEIAGTTNASIAAVDQKKCTACCRHFEPDAKNLNAYFASLLFDASREIIALGGVDGCDVAKAQGIQARAVRNLQTVNLFGEKRPGRMVPRTGPCFYLGEATGELRPCTNCKGSVRQKVFGCHHEAHSDTVLANCDECHDYDPPLLPSGNQSQRFEWVVSMRSAPRNEPTFAKSLASLAAAGWDEPHLFVEPSTEVPDGVPSDRLTVRAQKLGNWPNLYTSLAELVMRHPRADAYMMCEDDVAFCKGLRPYLEENLWPSKRLGVVSLHTPQHQDRGDTAGFYVANPGWGAWGAQAFVFPNASARALLRNPQIVNHRRCGPGDGLCNADSVVGQWCQDVDLDYYLHTPSLTQHIGETSTLWGEKATLEGRRHAATFIGEDQDIREVMGRPIPNSTA